MNSNFKKPSTGQKRERVLKFTSNVKKRNCWLSSVCILSPLIFIGIENTFQKFAIITIQDVFLFIQLRLTAPSFSVSSRSVPAAWSVLHMRQSGTSRKVTVNVKKLLCTLCQTFAANVFVLCVYCMCEDYYGLEEKLRGISSNLVQTSTWTD